MKKLLVILLVLAVIAGAAVLFLVGNLGGIIKGVVEKVGSDATQAPVTLQTVDLSLTDGKAELQKLVVGNPEGFKADHALSLGLVRVVIDTASLGSDPMVIKEVVVLDPEVIFEVGGPSNLSTNIGAIQEAVEEYTQRLPKGGGDAPTSEEPPADDAEAKKMIIEDLYIRNVQVQVAATALGGKGASATIKEIHLEDIGKDSGGATPGEVAAQFLDALLDGVLEAVSDLGIDQLDDVLKEKGAGLIEGAGKAIKGLFGGDDDE